MALDLVSRFLTLRGVAKSFDRIAKAQEVQCILLARIADRIAPEIQEPTEEEIRTAGPSFSRDREQSLLQDWLEDFQRKIGRPPTEQEVEAWFDEQDFPTAPADR